MKIGKNLTILPVLHGRIGVTKAVRSQLNTGGYDCIATPLPSIIEEEVVEIAEELPQINVIILQESETVAVIPADPCDAFIEEIKYHSQARSIRHPTRHLLNLLGTMPGVHSLLKMQS